MIGPHLIASIKTTFASPIWTHSSGDLMPLKPQGRIFNDITETIGGTPLVRDQPLDPQGSGDRPGEV